MTEDIKINFNSINEIAKTKATRLEIHKTVRRSIQMHFNAKQFSEIVSLLHDQKIGFTFFFCSFRLFEICLEETQLLNWASFLWAFIAICCSLLLIQMELVCFAFSSDLIFFALQI